MSALLQVIRLQKGAPVVIDSLQLRLQLQLPSWVSAQLLLISVQIIKPQ